MDCRPLQVKTRGGGDAVDWVLSKRADYTNFLGCLSGSLNGFQQNFCRIAFALSQSRKVKFSGLKTAYQKHSVNNIHTLIVRVSFSILCNEGSLSDIDLL